MSAEPRPRVTNNLDKVERTNAVVSLTMAERDLLARAASKEGKQLVSWIRQVALKAAGDNLN